MSLQATFWALVCCKPCTNTCMTSYNFEKLFVFVQKKYLKLNLQSWKRSALYVECKLFKCLAIKKKKSLWLQFEVYAEWELHSFKYVG